MYGPADHRVTFLPEGWSTRVPDGATILDAANWAGLPIDSVCGGRGTCGKCRVTVTARRGAMATGSVLACRTAIQSDCTVEIPTPAAARQKVRLHGRSVAVSPNVQKLCLRLAEPSPDDARSDLRRVAEALAAAGLEPRANPTVLRDLPRLLRESGFFVTAVICGGELIAVERGDTTGQTFGVALDIGTTTVAAAIVNLETGAVEAEESLLNRQVSYGADVIARISHAVRTHGLADLQESIVGTIHDLLASTLERSGVRRDQVYEAVAVGNATMLHLLLGIDPRGIGVSPFAPAFQDPVIMRAADLGLRLHPEARLTTLPLLGAYVGADIVSGLLATEFLRGAADRPRLYIDIGTNGEIAVRSGERCLCAAAPAGPAFEGAQIRCGMRASEGAIEQVEIAGDVRLRIIGGGSRPAGICGSGLIDAVAALRTSGLLDESGRLARPEEASGRVPDAVARRVVRQNAVAGFLLSAPEDGIVLTQADIRALQYAKAAIAAGTAVLLSRLAAAPQDVGEVLLAGAFGSYLRPASARILGLVPWIPVGRIRAVGNAAGEGALAALLSRGEREAARQMTRHVEYEEISGSAEFSQRFTAALAFPPILNSE